jgi:hypothetical protein
LPGSFQPTYFAMTLDGISEAGSMADFNTGSPLVPSSSTMNFFLLDNAFGIMCSVSFDVSQTMSSIPPTDPRFNQEWDGALNPAMAATDCPSVSPATWGVSDLRDYFGQFAWPIAIGQMDPLTAANYWTGLPTWATDYQPYAMSLWLDLGPGYAYEMGLTMGYARTCQDMDYNAQPHLGFIPGVPQPAAGPGAALNDLYITTNFGPSVFFTP